ncbi:MAG: CDP-alcohol phosphatidyltransferase family protein [Chloroflexi bacterium]|nr:CDP-alcohol phosphatidyltransferase family protein [Chloroflexota bacterium]
MAEGPSAPGSPDSYSALEKLIREPVRAFLYRLYRPIVLLLASLGISPNFISFLQIPVGLMIVWAIIPYPKLAFLLMLLAIALDGIDGALSRHLGRSSAFGALWDNVCDHIREVLVIAGLAWVGALNGFWAALYGLAYPGVNITLALCNHYRTPLPLAIKTYLTAYPFIFLYLWLGINWLNIGIPVSVLAMVAAIFQGLYLLSKAMDRTVS